MISIQETEDKREWDNFVKSNGGHPLQLWGWGEVKKSKVWIIKRLLFVENEQVIGAGQVLIRKLPKPFSKMLYVPRGPVSSNENRKKILKALADWSKKQGATFAKIEPNWTTAHDLTKPWKKSKSQILLPDTLQMDLSIEPDKMLAEMNAKTRQNIRRSLRYGITMREATSDSDIKSVMNIYRETAKRANFAIHSDNYYRSIIDHFGDDCRIYVALHENRIVSFVWDIITPDTAFELYGGMNEEGKKLRANFALKWEVIQEERRRGTKFYDMNGLLAGGVDDFKRGFSPESTHWIGSYDMPLSPLYTVYEKALPLGKKIVQKLKNK